MGCCESASESKPSEKSSVNQSSENLIQGSPENEDSKVIPISQHPDILRILSGQGSTGISKSGNDLGLKTSEPPKPPKIASDPPLPPRIPPGPKKDSTD